MDSSTVLTYSFATPSHVKQKSEARRPTIYFRQGEATYDVYCSCRARFALSRDVTHYARRIQSTEGFEEFELSFVFD